MCVTIEIETFFIVCIVWERERDTHKFFVMYLLLINNKNDDVHDDVCIYSSAVKDHKKLFSMLHGMQNDRETNTIE